MTLVWKFVRLIDPSDKAMLQIASLAFEEARFSFPDEPFIHLRIGPIGDVWICATEPVATAILLREQMLMSFHEWRGRQVWSSEDD